jgi:hypothetical protein
MNETDDTLEQIRGLWIELCRTRLNTPHYGRLIEQIRYLAEAYQAKQKRAEQPEAARRVA